MAFVRHALHLYVILMVVAAVAICATPVGKVSSAEPFQLRGAQVPVAGVPSWPVMSGDEIGAVTAPVAITLKDGSRVTLTQGSKARIEEQDGKALFRLLAGSGEYILGSKSSTALYVKDKATPVQAGSKGVISVESRTVTGTRVKAALLPPPPPVLSSR